MGIFEGYPFNIDIIKNLDEIKFNSKIKVIEGDNEINNLSNLLKNCKASFFGEKLKNLIF